MLKISKLAKILVLYIFVAVIFYFVGGDQLKFKYVVSNMGTPVGALEEIDTNTVISTKFAVQEATLETIDLRFATFGRNNSGTVYLRLLDDKGKEVEKGYIDAGTLKDNEEYKWVISPGIEANGKIFELEISSNSLSGQAPSIYFTNERSGNQSVFVNGESRDVELCMDYVGKKWFLFGTYYWEIICLIAVLIVAYYVRATIKAKHGKQTILSNLEMVWERYGFLIKQLISRDFKTKYKRSVLGYLWSFLNPLLTMLVQYVVFSKIFRSDIENFPVYLLSGIILFNFFTDAVGQGLTAIVDNASLITKVYVPKYIYPITKVASCSINLLISVIPLLIVALLTGTRITIAIILIPFALLCMLIFCIGMSLILCTTMVFFRDTRYLWGVISMVWMYATPIFYPENIVPAEFRFVQTLNPIYHCIRFIRIILINGVSPEPQAYLFCALSAFVTFLVGAAIFKRFQDKFILYI